MVPERPDRPRERAGDRRPLRALRARGRGQEPGAVVLPDHRLRGRAARRDVAARVLARARADDAAQLDRPLRGRRAALPFRRARRGHPGLHDAAGHDLRRHVLRGRARAPTRPGPGRRQRARAGGARVRSPRWGPDRGRARGEGEGRRLHRPPRREPRDRRADADLGRRLRAHGVRHRRDHGRPRARRARLRLRGEVRPARAHRCRAGRRRRGPGRAGGRVHRALRERGARQLERLHAGSPPRGQGADRPLARVRGPRPREGRLPAARLAPLPPALLGLPDPGRPLPRVRDRRRAGRPAARRAPRGDGLPAEGPLAARGRGGLGQHDLPAVRWRGEARDRHDGHLRRLGLVLHPVRGLEERRTRRSTARSPISGCRSTSTSAESSTRSST